VSRSAGDTFIASGLVTLSLRYDTFLDHCANRERNQIETVVDRALSNLNSGDNTFSRADIVRVLKTLEELNCGQFVTGRRGWPSRFVWHAEMTSVGRVAAGEDQELEPSEELSEETGEGAPPAGSTFLSHVFHLRPNAQIEFELPDDLRPDEAKRLAGFIRTLPFDVEP
jgi:hypothetical protein